MTITREELSNKINFTGKLFRYVSVYREDLDIELNEEDYEYECNISTGDILKNLGNCWSKEKDAYIFELHNDRNCDFSINYICENLAGHEIDYTDEELVDEIVAYEDEKEVLVSNSTKFIVIKVDMYEDYDYVDIYLEVVK